MTFKYIATIAVFLAAHSAWAGPHIAVGHKPIAGACAAQAMTILQNASRFEYVKMTNQGNVLAESGTMTVLVTCAIGGQAIISASGDYSSENNAVVTLFRSQIK